MVHNVPVCMWELYWIKYIMDIVQYKKKKRNDAFYFILATCSTENVFMGAPAMENMVNITGSVDLDIMR